MEESEDHWVREVGHHCVHQGDADYLVTQDVAAVFILLREEEKVAVWERRAARCEAEESPQEGDPRTFPVKLLAHL